MPKDDRVLPNWIDGYLQFMKDTEPPFLFKKWAAISAIAACLQRKCYIPMFDSNLYPNMYIVLVGPSACRKGTALAPALRMIRDLGIPLAADATTREALIRRLEQARTAEFNEQGIPQEHCSLTAFATELTVFLGYDNQTLLDSLVKWFDCEDEFKYETKNCGTNVVNNVFFNLIGATTPTMLLTALPQTAIGLGLTSRMVFIYGDKKDKLVPNFMMSEEARLLRGLLLEDLKKIHLIKGEFDISRIQETYEEWYLFQEKNPPLKDHNFEPYLGRRAIHLLKLAMIHSAARSSDRIVTDIDFSRAVHTLEEAEKVMPLVFRSYGRRDTAEVLDRMMRLIATRKKISRGELINLFYRDATTEEIDAMCDTLHAMRPQFAEKKIDGNRNIWMVYKELGEIENGQQGEDIKLL